MSVRFSISEICFCATEVPGHLDLGHLAGATEFLEGDLLCDQKLGELLDLAAASGGEGLDDFVTLLAT